MTNSGKKSAPYTCNEYREEMTLLGLRRRLKAKDLGAEEKRRLIAEIQRIEKKMGLD